MLGLGEAEWGAVALSLKVSFWATVLSLPLALITAQALARGRFWGKSALNLAVHLPLLMPPVVTGYLLLVLFGTQGPLGRFFAIFGVEFAFRWTGAALRLIVVSILLSAGALIASELLAARMRKRLGR